MRTGVAISRTNRSIFSVSHTEQGRRTWPAMPREKMLLGGGENLAFIGR
jgi:hypothetical protein